IENPLQSAELALRVSPDVIRDVEVLALDDGPHWSPPGGRGLSLVSSSECRWSGGSPVYSGSVSGPAAGSVAARRARRRSVAGSVAARRARRRSVAARRRSAGARRLRLAARSWPRPAPFHRSRATVIADTPRAPAARSGAAHSERVA